MSQSATATPRGLRGALATLVALLATLFAGLTGHLVAVGPGLDASATTALVVLLVSLTGLALAGSRHGALVAPTVGAPPGRWRSVAPLLTTRVTDPTAHPRRPRAPGTA